MSDISKFSEFNVGSLCKIEFMDARHAIGTYNENEMEVIISAYPPGGVLYIDELYFIPGTGSFVEKEKQDINGSMWEQEVRCIVPKSRQEVAAEIVAMKGRRYMIKITDCNGNVNLIGSQDEPARLISTKKIPAEKAEYNSYEFVFACNSRLPAFFVVES